MRRTIDLYRRGKDLSERGMQQEARDLLLAAVEAARGYGQHVAEIYRTMLWVVLDVTGRIYGHPKQYEFEGCMSAFRGLSSFVWVKFQWR